MAIINTETGEILGKATEEERDILFKIAIFLNNENIEIIPRIYQGKVEDHIIVHLLDSARYYRDVNNNNSLAWIDFIGNLDKKNRQILEDYIFNR
jgi:DNA replication initiation complex subunit (GINS family)